MSGILQTYLMQNQFLHFFLLIGLIKMIKLNQVILFMIYKEINATLKYVQHYFFIIMIIFLNILMKNPCLITKNPTTMTCMDMGLWMVGQVFLNSKLLMNLRKMKVISSLLYFSGTFIIWIYIPNLKVVYSAWLLVMPWDAHLNLRNPAPLNLSQLL